jgi:hypothetical protein
MPFDILSGDSRMREVLTADSRLKETGDGKHQTEIFMKEFRQMALYED